MSLDPRDSRRRDRSKSPGRRDNGERSRSRVRAPSPPSTRYEDDSRERSRGTYDYEERETTTIRSSKGPAVVDAEPRYDSRDPRDPRYTDPRIDPRDPYSQYSAPSSGPPARPDYAVPGAFENTASSKTREKDYYADKGYGKRDEYERAVSPPTRSRYEEVDKYKYSGAPDRNPNYYEDDSHSQSRERGASFNVSAGHHSISGGVNIGHDKPQYVQPPSPSDYMPGRHASYAEPKKYEYAQPEEKVTYTRKQSETTYAARPASPPYVAASSSRSRHGSSTYQPDSARSSKSQVVTVEPGSRRYDDSLNPGLAPRMHSLSVSTGHHGSASMNLANAPGSPLLESYHGTYQSISPMPSPLMIAATAHSDINLIEPLSPQSSDDERRGKKGRRNARFHDPEEEAKILAQALKGEKRAPDTEPLIEILPGLTHEQVLDLRVEYKRIVKTGSEKKGVNIAKHIKLRLKEEDPSLMKACYACALGRWESEAYWANFWYQGEKSRRELLIESLMGRTNREISQIKDGFADKKYSDSLTKCMKTELKEDKFKKAVLMVLEENKMEESTRIDRDLLEDDVRDLHKAVRAEKGGESLMISIIVVRSDTHLREVLRSYEASYRSNFAREMLKKSGNLVVCLIFCLLVSLAISDLTEKSIRESFLLTS
jgi:hypothetical protein